MPKKKTSKKFDLSHLASLSQSVAREPLETPLEPPKAPTQDIPPVSAQEEPPNSPAPVIISAQPEEEPEQIPIPVEETPAPPQEEAPTNRRYFDKKPYRKEIKPVKTLESATNTEEEVFQPGDKILVKAPWGGNALAEITVIYQDESGNAWAHYLPLESVPSDWSWLGGCSRSSLLMKA
ncbi:MAG TPA: hypothetical protein V6D14_34290 [Coleofasciculaceae cyanobacterium]|jgi:hypothetical protein